MYSLKLAQITDNPDIIIYEAFTFPGGECHIKLGKPSCRPCKENAIDKIEVLIEASINNSDELIMVLMANDALRRRGYKNISLLMPYIPYARQDRVMVQGEPLSIKVLTNLINGCNFDKVYVLDPHSNVSTALLNNVVTIPMDYLLHELPVMSYDTLVSPDEGARKKTETYAKFFEIKRLIYFHKERNLNTGDIIGIQTDNGYPCVECDSSIWVIDDICDGGRTFLEIGKKLDYNYPSTKKHLFITHGVFKNGVRTVEQLREYYSSVWTTNSLPIRKSIAFEDKANFIKIKKEWLV